MLVNATFNNISYIVVISFIGGANRSTVLRGNHRPVASH
jgi:hypothetical protein